MFQIALVQSSRAISGPTWERWKAYLWVGNLYERVSSLIEGCSRTTKHTFGGTKVVIVLRIMKLMLGKLFSG